LVDPLVKARKAVFLLSSRFPDWFERPYTPPYPWLSSHFQRTGYHSFYSISSLEVLCFFL